MSEAGGRRIIVIYQKKTGKVKAVKMTGDIHRRSELSEACGGIPQGELGFTREPRGVEVDIGNDFCKQAIRGEPFMLYGKEGNAKFQKVVMEEAKKEIEKSLGIFIDPRPGIGDFILAAECAVTTRSEYPEKNIILGGAPKFKSLCEHLEPLITWGGTWGDGSRFKRVYYVNQRVGYQFDPRGGNFGHVAKYGVYLGVERMEGAVKLVWNYGEREEYINKIGAGERGMESPILGIHIKSASSHTRSWNKKAAAGIAARWKKEKGGDVFLFGEKKDYGLAGEGYWNIEPGQDILTAAAMVKECNVVVCVDSGILHLARIQKVKQVCLWGGTRPGIVLGRDPGSNDLIGDVGCGYAGCHLCDKKKAVCMEAITEEQVWNKIIEVIDE